jgi:hypothetical protein
VKVFDKNGKLKRIIPTAELKQAQSTNKLCLKTFKRFTSFGKGKPNELTAEHKKTNWKIPHSL